MEEKENNTQSTEGAPVFDMEQVVDKSPEEIDAYAKDYTDAVTRYVKDTLAGEISGTVEELEKREKEAELSSARASLMQKTELYDFSENIDTVDKLISAIPGMSELAPESAMTLCYLMIKGAAALSEHNNPKVESPEEIAERIYKRGDVMKLLASYRAKDSLDGELPVMAKGAGSAVNIKSKPKTLADARMSAEKHFNI